MGQGITICSVFLSGMYLTISMAVTSVSVILTVCVLKLHHCGPRQKKVPRWLRILVLQGLARVVNCDCSAVKKKKKIGRHKTAHHSKSGNNSSDTDACLRLVSEITSSRCHKSPVVDFRRPHIATTTTSFNHHQHNSSGSHNNDYSSSNNHVPPQLPPTTRLMTTNMESVSADIKRLSVMEEILKYLKVIVRKRDEDDVEEDVINEWRQVAAVVDRFFFWFFLTLTVIATVAIMVLIPLFRDLKLISSSFNT